MTFIILTLISALILLDKYAVGEFGISQPIISGTIIGALFGDIKTGIFLGSCFQLIFLTTLPIGREIPPDGQAAGLAGCGFYFLLLRSNTPDCRLFFSIIIGILAGIIGSIIDITIRNYNERLYHLFLRNSNLLSFYHLAGVGTAFLRGILLFLPLFIIANFIHFPALPFIFNRKLFMQIVVGIGVANGLYLFLKRRNLLYFILGLLCSSALAVY